MHVPFQTMAAMSTHRKNIFQTILFAIYFLSSNSDSAPMSWVECQRPENSPFVNYAFSQHVIFANSGTSGGFYRSTDLGKSWNRIDAGLPPDIFKCTPLSDSIVYISNQYTLFRSMDTGNHWNNITFTFSPIPRILSVAANTANLFVALSNDSVRSIFRGSLDGTDWKELSNSSWYPELRFLTANDSTLFASLSDGLYTLSPDAPDGWEKSKIGLPAQCAIMAFANNGKYLFLGTDNVRNGGIFQSDDNGKTWIGKNEGFEPFLFVNALAATREYIFTSVGNGEVYSSADNGSTWKALSFPCCSDTFAYRVAICGEDLFVVTNYGALWRLPLAQVAVQNHPVYPSDTPTFYVRVSSRPHSLPSISFRMPCPEMVTVKVYSLSGHEITSCANRTFGAGAHTLSLETCSISAGLYMIKIQAGLICQIKTVPFYR
jgi:photosystem II stability/assembly factor-like uncharacterized protein